MLKILLLQEQDSGIEQKGQEQTQVHMHVQYMPKVAYSQRRKGGSIMQGLVGHSKEFGFYVKRAGKPLSSFQHGSDNLIYALEILLQFLGEDELQGFKSESRAPVRTFFTVIYKYEVGSLDYGGRDRHVGKGSIILCKPKNISPHIFC